MEKVEVEWKLGCEKLVAKLVDRLNELFEEAERIRKLPSRKLREVEVDGHDFYIERVLHYAEGNPFGRPVGYHWECSIPGVLITNVAEWGNTVHVELAENSRRPKLPDSRDATGRKWVFK